jgi:argininosuccinate lyase
VIEILATERLERAFDEAGKTLSLLHEIVQCPNVPAVPILREVVSGLAKLKQQMADDLPGIDARFRDAYEMMIGDVVKTAHVFNRALRIREATREEPSATKH